MICPICGNEIPDEAVVCVKCGAQIPNSAKKTQVPGYTLGIVSLVLGILSVVTSCCLSFGNLIFAIAGLVLGIMSMMEAKKVGEKNTLALVGTICSGVGVLIGLVFIIILIAGALMSGM